MSFKRFLEVFGSILLLVAALFVGATRVAFGSTDSGDSNKCSSIDGTAYTGLVDLANGQFGFSVTAGTTSATFNGSGGTSSFSFTVTAPNAADADSDPVVFSGESQNSSQCTTKASATIGVLEITQVADANGNPESVDITSSNPLYSVIASSFSITPGTNIFSPGSSVSVGVMVTNPNVAAIYYGEYDVKIAAQAPGAGIGVGPGIEFDLTLGAPSVSSSCSITFTPAIGDANSNVVLGPVGFTVSASDTGSVLTSLTASISSAGGAVSSVGISLTVVPSLPAANVTATGTYTPADGATTLTSAFTSSSLSGIGTYTITVDGADEAGATCSKTDTFHVNYNVSNTRSFVPGGCSSSKTSSCAAQMGFTATRSDGTFMFDETVEMELLNSSSTVLATRSYGTGGIGSYVQINSMTPAPYFQYDSDFDGGSLTYGPYSFQLLFKDVDGNLVPQGSPVTVSF